MASVTSLDKDLRKLRLDKYTPAAANEARAWIEGILGERLPSSDLLEGLRDGVALCKLVNLAVGPPGVKFKQSSMPFVQMENISHFLRACQSPPLNLQQHDMFLTVDLYEQKDPAQVLQCIGAFGRAANSANPSVFPTSIGSRSGARGLLSPESTGSPVTPTRPTANRARGLSHASSATPSLYSRSAAIVPSWTGDSARGRWSPTKSPTASNGGTTSPVGVSSWSKREHEGATSPAWNIAQYGYMGGASQGNLGIAFGGRRQITSAGPHVPNAAEKLRKRKESEAEAERQRMQMEEEERRRKSELEAEEARAREQEERGWEEETRRAREEERRNAEEEKRRWEEEERQWKLTEEQRRKEEEEANARLQDERQQRARAKSDLRLRGQYLSQYKAEQEGQGSSVGSVYTDRVKELERALDLARQREAEYERERQGRSQRNGSGEDKGARTRSRSRPAARPPSRQDSWRPRDEQLFLRAQWAQHQQQEQAGNAQPSPPPQSPRPLPDPIAAARFSPSAPSTKVKIHRTGENAPPATIKTHRTGETAPPPPIWKQHTGPRPLPDPAAYVSTPGPQLVLAQKQSPSPNMSRTDRHLASNPVSQLPAPQQGSARELGATEERDSEDWRRAATQRCVKSGGWASKSLLEREMEMERQRQREWEESQKETAKAVRSSEGVDGIGGGMGGRWDVSQWSGYTGGDSQNKGGQGIGAGRRQIVGPRPLPGSR